MHENTSKQDLFGLKLAHHDKVQIYEREHERQTFTTICEHLVKHGADRHTNITRTHTQH